MKRRKKRHFLFPCFLQAKQENCNRFHALVSTPLPPFAKNQIIKDICAQWLLSHTGKLPPAVKELGHARKNRSGFKQTVTVKIRCIYYQKWLMPKKKKIKWVTVNLLLIKCLGSLHEIEFASLSERKARHHFYETCCMRPCCGLRLFNAF